MLSASFPFTSSIFISASVFLAHREGRRKYGILKQHQQKTIELKSESCVSSTSWIAVKDPVLANCFFFSKPQWGKKMKLLSQSLFSVSLSPKVSGIAQREIKSKDCWAELFFFSFVPPLEHLRLRCVSQACNAHCQPSISTQTLPYSFGIFFIWWHTAVPLWNSREIKKAIATPFLCQLEKQTTARKAGFASENWATVQ